MSKNGIRKTLTKSTNYCNLIIVKIYIFNSIKKEVYEKNNSIQEWLPFERILKNGIIKLKNNSYIKIIKIYPINFNLKSELEKEAILNSYKIFLKTCDFNFQILIQSKKEDLSKHISNINCQKEKEEKSISDYSNKYIEYIQSLNHQKKSSSKNFYIILKYKNDDKKIKTVDDLAIENLNDKYFKIKDCLSRCGNGVIDINNINDSKNVLFSFLNSRIYLNN